LPIRGRQVDTWRPLSLEQTMIDNKERRQRAHAWVEEKDGGIV